MAEAGRKSSGVVTLLFTDVVGSTEMLDRVGDDVAEEMRCRHFTLLRRALDEAGGSEVKSLGDGLMASFTSPRDALGCAVAMQRAVAEANRSDPGAAVRVRIGLHAGETVADDGDYFGRAVVVAKRLCDRADAGQILAGDLVRVLVGSGGGFRFTPAGHLTLKGLAEPLAAVVVEWGPVSVQSTPPARTVAVAPRRRSSRGAPSLVGREPELARLDAEFDRARAGELRCLLLIGEPGLGKTRLADEFARRRSPAAHVVAARAYPLGGTLAFSLWAEALEPALAAMSSEEIVGLCGGFVDDLAGLLHGVAALRGRAPPGEPSRFRLIEGLTRVLDRLGRDRPVIVVLDDIHLADPSSWDVLRHLTRRLPDLPLLVLATARPAELAANEVAAQVLLELEQDGGLTRLQLGALSRTGLAGLAEVLVGRPPPPALVDWLEDRTRGNALFASGLVQALLEEGADLAAPRLQRLPESLTERVISRLKSASEAERTTFELIAVLGRPATLGELGLITGRTLDELVPILAGLMSIRGVTEEERGRDLTYEIHHPLVRDITYQAIGGARRRLLHRDVATALHRHGRTAEAARHFARSADVGDADAIDALREAVRQAESREAYREALELLGELGELLPSGDPRWLDVSEALSWRAEWVVDHRADTHALLGIRALRELDGLLATSPDAARRAAVKFRLANLLAWGTGELQEAESALRDATALLGPGDDRREALLVDRELAWVLGLRGHFAAMEAKATAVADEAVSLGDRFVEMQALSAAGYAATFQGRFRAAEDHTRRALTIAREDLKTYRHTAAAAGLAAFISLEGRTGEALSMLTEAKADDPDYRDTSLLEIETQVHWLGGDYPAALATAREAAAWSPTLSRRRACMGVFAAIPALEAGEVAEAQRFIARAQGALDGRDWSVYHQLCLYAEGMLAWQQGRSDDALAVLRRSSSTMFDWGALSWVVFCALDLAEIEGATADPDAAEATAGRLRQIADATGAPVHRGLAALASSWAGYAAGNLPEAAAQARMAVAELAASDWRALRARAHDALGRAVAEADRSTAVTALRQAVDLFQAAGAVVRRDRALDALRSLGSSGKRAAAAAGGPGSLTAREREVARLAAGGSSARQIAQKLFVSERTIETHLTRVYAKLGVTSKVELVRRAAELPL
jgi:class 3 adenylate cyclase/DNA-binding NarL/FixJ family response regulator